MSSLSKKAFLPTSPFVYKHIAESHIIGGKSYRSANDEYRGPVIRRLQVARTHDTVTHCIDSGLTKCISLVNNH